MSQPMRKLVFQLDYYMSAQFAGMAMALRSGLYQKAGINLHWLPPCPPGDEAKVVGEGFQSGGGATLWMGCMEQNTLLPAVAQGCQVKAVAAMFGRSPLCIAGLPGSNLRSRIAMNGNDALRVGAHVDTLDLLQRIFPKANILELPRGGKLQYLKDGKVDAVQAYDVMETLRLADELNGSPEVVSLHNCGGVSLGYAQVIFAPVKAFDDVEHRGLLRSFLKVTFDGWRRAMHEPREAADAVLELQSQQGTCEGEDHWISTPEFTESSVRRCNDYVKRTMRCGRLGVIDRESWSKAAAWLGATLPDYPEKGNAAPALETSLWHVNDCHLDGHPVAEILRSEAQLLAGEAKHKHGRLPKLVVVTVGKKSLGRQHLDGDRRLQLFASSDTSWFSKQESGAALGIDVEEVNLPESVSTEQLLAELRRHHDSDGLQLMWPLPPHIDATLAYSAIPMYQDVDGAQFLARSQASVREGAQKIDVSHAPATCGGIGKLLQYYDISLEGLKTLVVGRSGLLGQPLAAMFCAEGATVTLAHRKSVDLQKLCGEADLLVSAAGSPRLIQGKWVKPGATVINIGTSFANDTIVPDVAPFEDFKHAKLVVRTVGPLSAAMLFRNVAEVAASRPVRPIGATTATPTLSQEQVLDRLGSLPGWSLASGIDGASVLQRDFKVPSYKQAADFVHATCELAEGMNHHPNLQLTHQCTAGVILKAEVSTYACTAITEFDFELASKMSELYESSTIPVDSHIPDVKMEDFNYVLPDSLVAQYPVEPRDSSRLLFALPEAGTMATQVATDMQLVPGLHDRVFADLAELLPANAHLVCNKSEVFTARVFATGIPGNQEPVEVMFLGSDLSGEDLSAMLNRPCSGQLWRCMIRSPLQSPGLVLKANHAATVSDSFSLQILVERLHSKWLEEGEVDGVEATVRMLPSDSKIPARCVFDMVGFVPLPPYMQRSASDADRSTYQTVFASSEACGSVAAPTAGLHFTSQLQTRLQAKGVKQSQLALHVGAGTFRPVTSNIIADHSMHEEPFSVNVHDLREVVQSLRSSRPIVPVGTTTVRTLESLYWLGVRPSIPQMNETWNLHQWEAYRLQNHFAGALPSAAESLSRLCRFADQHGLDTLRGSTRLCIVPGYQFQVCDALITNFHQPDSTLLLLVSAFVGQERMREAYQHAVQQKYRFLSYGDACFFFKKHEAQKT